MSDLDEIERSVRTRLRTLRNTLGLSLNDLAARTNLSPSTISRIETGHRTMSLDVLLPLASALQVDLGSLLHVRSDDDVIIRPVPNTAGDRTTWLLSRPTGNTVAVKIRLEPTTRTPDPRVTPVTTGSSSSTVGCACCSASASSSSQNRRRGRVPSRCRMAEGAPFERQALDDLMALGDKGIR